MPPQQPAAPKQQQQQQLPQLPQNLGKDAKLTKVADSIEKEVAGTDNVDSSTGGIQQQQILGGVGSPAVVTQNSVETANMLVSSSQGLSDTIAPSKSHLDLNPTDIETHAPQDTAQETSQVELAQLDGVENIQAQSRSNLSVPPTDTDPIASSSSLAFAPETPSQHNNGENQNHSSEGNGNINEEGLKKDDDGDEQERDVTATSTDSDIFHGFEFDANSGKRRLYSRKAGRAPTSATNDTGEGDDDFPDVRPLRNPLDELDPQSRIEEETHILSKYLKHGALTTFRGRDDMHIFKSRIMTKHEIKKARNLVTLKESEMNRLEDMLIDMRENRQRARDELDQVAEEMEQVIESVHKSSVKIPRHKQVEHMLAMKTHRHLVSGGLAPHHKAGASNASGQGEMFDDVKNGSNRGRASGAATGSLANIGGNVIGNRKVGKVTPGTSGSSSGIVLPSDSNLMLNQRYRMLRDHYYQHQEYIEKASQAIPELEAALVPLREELSELHAHLWALRPLNSKLAEAELQEHTELQVVAKYRALEAERRQAAYIRHQTRLAREADQANTDHTEKQRQISDTVHAHSAQMRRWFLRTLHRAKIERDTRLHEKLDASEKKKQAMVLLQTHIEQIKDDIRIENDRRKAAASVAAATTAAADSLAENNRNGVPNVVSPDEFIHDTPLLKKTKEGIASKKLEHQRRLDLHRARKDEQKMHILYKLVEMENKRREMEAERQRHVNLQRALESRAPSPNRAFPPDVIRLNVVESDPFAPPRVASRPHSHDRRHPGSRLPSPSPTRLDRIDHHIQDQQRKERSREREERRKSTKFVENFQAKRLSSPFSLLKLNQPPVEATTVPHQKSRHENDDSGGMFSHLQMLVSNQNLSALHERPRPPPPRMTNYKPQKLQPRLYPSANSFFVSPSEFMFKDYTNDRATTANATITNISGRINSFKLLPIPIEVSEFFDVKFSPPCKIGPGTSWDISVVFHPPSGFNDDIPPTRISFVAEIGGEFYITVGCNTCKCRPVVACVGGEKINMVKFYDKVDPPGVVVGMRDVLTPRLLGDDTMVTPHSLDDLGVLDRKRQIDGDVHRIAGIVGNRKQQPVAQMTGEHTVSMDLGSCVVGARKTLFLNLANLGATSVGYQILPEHVYLKRISESHTEPDQITQGDNDPTGQDAEPLAVAGSKPATAITPSKGSSKKRRQSQPPEWKIRDGVFVARGRSGNLNGYTSNVIHFDFCPPYMTSPRPDAESNPKAVARAFDGKPSTANFVIAFSREDIEPIHVKCNALALEAPIFVNRDLIDFKICVFNHSYQDHLIVRNHNNISLKFWIEYEGTRVDRVSDSNTMRIPGLGDIEVTPAFAFAQPYEPFHIWFKIKPVISACDMSGTAGRKPFSVPMQIKYKDAVTDDERAIPISVAGVLTSDDVTLHAVNGDAVLDFGVTSTLETKELSLIVTNTSILPQMIRFNKSHAFLTVLPLSSASGNDCIASLGPRESVTCVVQFDPTEEAEYDVQLTCQSTWGRTFAIRCTGVGVKPLARFEHSQVVFEPCAFGNTRSLRVRLLCGPDATQIRSGAKHHTKPHGRENTTGFKIGSATRHHHAARANHKRHSTVMFDLFDTELGGVDDQVTFEFGAPIVVGLDTYASRDTEQLIVDMLKLEPDPAAIQVAVDAEVNGTAPVVSGNNREASRTGSIRTSTVAGPVPAVTPILMPAISETGQSLQALQNTSGPTTSSDEHKAIAGSRVGSLFGATPTDRACGPNLFYPLTANNPQIVQIWPPTGTIDGSSPASIELSLAPPLRKHKAVHGKSGDASLAHGASHSGADNTGNGNGNGTATATTAGAAATNAAAITSPPGTTTTPDRAGTTAKNKTGSTDKLPTVKAGGKNKDGAGKESSRAQARLAAAANAHGGMASGASVSGDTSSKLKSNGVVETTTDNDGNSAVPGLGAATQTGASATPGSANGNVATSLDDTSSSTSAFARHIATIDSPVVTLLVPCYLKRTISDQNRLRAFVSGISAAAPSAESDTTQPTDKSANGLSEPAVQSSIIYIKVVAPLFQPDLVLVDPETGKLDMERVPVGVRGYRDITVRNTSIVSMRIRCSGFGPLGPFRLVKGNRVLGPHETSTLRIAFEPEIDRRFSSILEIASSRAMVKVRLTGEGVHPSIQIDPPERVVSLGDVCLGDQATKTFKISNVSVIPITFVCSLSCVRPETPWTSLINTMHDKEYEKDGNSSLSDFLADMQHNTDDVVNTKQHGIVNHSGTNAFTVSPLRCTVAPGAFQDITIRFTPDRESDLFFDQVSIRFWGQPEPVFVRVHGRAWGATTSILGYDVPPARACENTWAPTPQSSIEDAYRKLEGTQGELFKPGYILTEEIGKVSEDLVVDMARMCGWRDYHFATFTLPWRKIPLEGAPDRLVWRIEPREIVFANMKPILTKLDFGKKSPLAEYTIEKFPASFEFDEELGDFVVCPAVSLFSRDSPMTFSLEPGRGTIEIGQTKSLRIVVNDPVRDFWAGFSKTWGRISTAIPAAGADGAAGGGFKDRGRASIGNGTEPMRKRSLKSNAIDAQRSDDPILMTTEIETETLNALLREAGQIEPAEPYYVESVFKITFRGGCRLVEPKGPMFPGESRIWLVKIKADGKMPK